MPIKHIDIKKELTEEEFKEHVVVCEQKFEKETDINRIALGCETKTKEITPAQEAYVLIPKYDTNEFKIVTLDKTIPMALESESILTECFNTKQPLIVNDATRSFLYNEKNDNFLNLEIKDLLLIPITDDTSEKKVLAIMWTTVLKGSWNQYTQKDLTYMTRFSIFIKRFLQNKDLIITETKEDGSFLDCMEAYDELSAKSRREQEYFSTIIHDVRTPMNAVIGFLELLNIKEEDEEKKEYLKVALKSAETMVTLINDALDISKMASGKMNIEMVEFSIIKELSDVAKLFHNSAKKKNISFSTFYDPLIPDIIVSDYHRIKQIMNNLLSNAIKFTPENGEIFLELLYDKKHDGLTVSVIDSGAGIAKDMQKSIFFPYTQEKKSTSREHGGTGLGLSISKQLSVLLGGSLKLKSKIGEGSKFYFTIPCNTPTSSKNSFDYKKLENVSVVLFQEESNNPTILSIKRYLKSFNVKMENVSNSKELLSKDFNTIIISRDDALKYDKDIQKISNNKKSIIILGDTFLQDGCRFDGNIQIMNSPILPNDVFNFLLRAINLNISISHEDNTLKSIQNFSNKKILVVDDNSINLKFMQEVLKTMNIKTTLAFNGLEGLQEYKNNKVDLIFMDENMPGIQGNETISKIREYEKQNKIENSIIIGLTGDANKDTKEHIMNSGANEVLTKPIQLKEIQRVITTYL